MQGTCFLITNFKGVGEMRLAIGNIIIDKELNVRNQLYNDTIDGYMDCFDQLPPVVVFATDEGNLLADGFHRIKAAKKLGLTEIEADVKQGTRKDAEEYAVLANLKHGKPLTRKERQKAIKRMLILHPERANNWIAEELGVSDMTVKKYREELESASQIGKVDEFLGKDGKVYPREIPHPKREEHSSADEPGETTLFDKADPKDSEPSDKGEPTTAEQEHAPKDQEGEQPPGEKQAEGLEQSAADAKSPSEEESDALDASTEQSQEDTTGQPQEAKVNVGAPDEQSVQKEEQVTDSSEEKRLSVKDLRAEVKEFEKSKNDLNGELEKPPELLGDVGGEAEVTEGDSEESTIAKTATELVSTVITFCDELVLLIEGLELESQDPKR
ncbi:MAG: hypothetical protein CMB97_00385, partial [Flavobacteriaceae bacterium]|nr:hypothetical protein [Flavobacteriaceae bacterium]